MSGKGKTLSAATAGKAQSRTTRHNKTYNSQHQSEKPRSLLQAARQATGLQPALRMGKANDPYERQADHIADRVVTGETQLFQRHTAQKPRLIKVQPFPALDKGLQSKAHDTSRADSKAAAAATQSAHHSAEYSARNARPDNQSLQAQEQEREVQAQQEEPLQAQEMDEDVQPQQDEEAPLQTQRKQQEVSSRQEQDQLQQAQAEEREVQAQQIEKEEPLQKGPLEAGALQEEGALQKEGALQAASATHANVVDPQQSLHDARQRSGSPLPDGVRDKMEHAFSRDFSGVRIHTDDPAVLLNQNLSARALTSGSDIFFNTGEFQPSSRAGEHLLAHELTHVVQQREAAANAPAQVQRKQEVPESYPIRPELLTALQHARSKIGLVNAKVTDADGNRVGWQLINEFFNTAFGGKHPLNEKVIQKIVMGKDAEGKPKDALPSWCGIFVWWSLKTAGLPIPDWKLGKGVLEHFNARPKGEVPRKGDIAYRDDHQHFGIVSGVEMQGPIARIATINGNSAGQDYAGGQIQEQWHGMEGWRGFLDTTSKLNLPEVELLTTQSGPDALLPEAEAEPAETRTTTAATELAADETAADVLQREPIASAAVLEAPTEAEVTTELPDIPPAPVLEPIAVIEPLALNGSSDQAVSTVANASASQIALDGDKLGGAVSDKLQTEQQEEMQGTPELQVNFAGNVSEGMTPAGELLPTSSPLDAAAQGPASAPLTAAPHQYAGPAPSNAANDETLDREEQSEGFFGWLRANFDKLLRGIRTSDPNLNTSAGPAPKVKLDRDANPHQMVEERGKRGDELRGKRDEVAGVLKDHPGQGNIQAKAVQQSKTVEMQNPEPAAVETAPEQTAADYAEAELPQGIRDKADAELGKQMQKDLNQADADAKGAASTKQTNKSNAIMEAEKATEKLNEKADDEQRNIVIDHRRQVADQQRGGIEQAYTEVNNFETEAGIEQRNKHKLIADEVKTQEDGARTELLNAEAKANKEKQDKEREAKDAKDKLDRERKKQSWWQRAKNRIKGAVKALTNLIDKAFNKLRAFVKDVIDKAKSVAIGLINKARNFVVEKLNDFRQWAKDKVNTYLGSTFPGLAARINGAIDSVVDTAVTGVNMAADAAIAGVEFIADNLAAALDKILSVYQAALKAAVQIIGAVMTGDFVEALKIAIRFACELAGIDPQPIFDFVERAGEQLVSILKRPVKFFNNLFDAVGLGVRNFVKNIKDHLIKGLVGWLTGALSEVSLTLPETFDIAGIFSLVMQILGLSYANIKARILKKYPAAEKVFDAIEESVEAITVLLDKGPAGLWELVKNSLANLEEVVMGAIRNYVITTVIKEAIGWLLGLLNPAGALVKILKLIFDLVMFLVERFNQIKDFVVSIYEALSAIAGGVIAKAAEAVENAMARSLPVIIGLLASLAGLNGIGKTVQGIIRKVTTPINRIIDAVVDKAVAFARRLVKKGTAVAKKVKDKLVQWWKVKRRFKAENGESHTLFFNGDDNNAELTMRSEQQPYQSFLNGLKDSDFNSAQQKHLQTARAVAKKIDAKRKESIAGKNDAETAQKAKKKQGALEALLVELANSTRHLFGTTLPDWETPDYGSENSAGFATSMKINILTKAGTGWKGGTAPSQAAHPVYDVLNQRRQSGGASFYIRGHLLNDNIGGPGQWKNMVPLSREGNHQHEAKVESYVKAGFNSMAIQRYVVTPKYGGHGGDTSLKKALGTLHPAQSATLSAVVDAEKQVPVSLTVAASRLVKKGSGYAEKDKKSWSISNPIQRSADKYFLGNMPKIVPVDINSLTSVQPLNAFNRKDIDTQAAAMLKAIQLRRKNHLPGFGTYSVLARETVDNGGSLTETRAKSWNTDGYIVLR